MNADSLINESPFQIQYKIIGSGGSLTYTNIVFLNKAVVQTAYPQGLLSLFYFFEQSW